MSRPEQTRNSVISEMITIEDYLINRNHEIAAKGQSEEISRDWW